MVFYLKYRPQRIVDLDSEQVREKLSSIVLGKNLPHAFLFTGPKGLGKTSAARILAKIINCTNRKPSDPEPCNKCIQCKSITEGTNLDVMEIDAASNRGIDEIRDLREKIRLSPISAKKKVYIIDEIHMLTTEAFNALLKTLEEPPNHAVFILCTTEIHKVPDTIMSRCFQVVFKEASEGELVRSLQRVLRGEGMNVDKDALSQIASLSDGSFRDGVKILEEVARAAGRKKITKELIGESYKVSSITKDVYDLIDFLSQRDLKSAVSLINALEEKGTDARFFTEELVSQIHGVLLKKLGIVEGVSDVSLSIEEIKNLFALISESYSAVKYSFLPFLPLEIAVIDWSQKKDSIIGIPFEKTLEEPAPNGLTPKHDKILLDLIDVVKRDNYSIAGVLRACSIKINGKDAVIETPYKFHKERLDEPSTRSLLANTLNEMMGKKINLEIRLKE
ncbi:MAG: DNA polymerase III, subunit gamma and tau [Candidatus Levybacteria bacterium RIFOXYA1_FULL_41_10]|nr:MAG: polymerase III, subunit gamma and tau protein [Candidatus Levybacteria bacterium GW2011_GWA1_39_34]KKR51280.1 MAG: polymerase III, subunit gamma and tau protein [Candidatus Levybacteria bacterium GW2011_GWC1_40_19]KKR73837.1 MAG: polymerase III, subunit gamma and tau protein [Candidatus Levybacteria bacterium GW2011_GWC2_40_7]KKR94633.1 MAG: polymerase III, subunit gamma and tau protein [Candidatus Levybacteria bacterium GW2011_GWA2_41_15]KKS02047.1 MAG: polymerase III, subunit gamma an